MAYWDWIDRKPPSASSYLAALRAVWPSDPARAQKISDMLKAQIEAKGTVSSTDLAARLGCSIIVIHGRYGRFGRQLGEHLGVERRTLDGWYRVLSFGSREPGITPHLLWTFHTTFEEALRRFPPTSGLFVRAPISSRPEPDDTDAEELDPVNDEDAREWIERCIAQRQGQHAFRSLLLGVYGGRCAVTDCDIEDVLEAAHIRPYRGAHTNKVENGLLLRADLHTLFDHGLIAVNPKTMRLVTAPTLHRADSGYEDLHGHRLRRVEPGQPEPSREALRLGYEEFRKRYPR